jgi:hypothetical protein
LADLIGKQFIRGPHGFDLGEIEEEAARLIGGAAAPIRLQHGYEGARGFGNRHVETYEGRMKQIRGLGFATFVQFASFVSVGFEKVLEGEDGRRILVRQKGGYDLRVVIEFIAGEDPFWTIVTGLPARIARGLVLYEKTRVDGSEPTSDVAVQRHRFATLSLPKKP